MATRNEQGGSSVGKGMTTSVRLLSVMRQDMTVLPWRLQTKGAGSSESFAIIMAESSSPPAAATYKRLFPETCTATAVPRFRSSLNAVKA